MTRLNSELVAEEEHAHASSGVDFLFAHICPACGACAANPLLKERVLPDFASKRSVAVCKAACTMLGIVAAGSAVLLHAASTAAVFTWHALACEDSTSLIPPLVRPYLWSIDRVWASVDADVMARNELVRDTRMVACNASASPVADGTNVNNGSATWSTSALRFEQCAFAPVCVASACVARQSGGLLGSDLLYAEAEDAPSRVAMFDTFELPAGMTAAGDEILAVPGDTLGAMWQHAQGAVLSTACGTAVGGNMSLLFLGDNPRSVTTAPIDTRTGGWWDFYFAYGNGGVGCPAVAFGGVELQYAHDPLACTVRVTDIPSSWWADSINASAAAQTEFQFSVPPLAASELSVNSTHWSRSAMVQPTLSPTLLYNANPPNDVSLLVAALVARQLARIATSAVHVWNSGDPFSSIAYDHTQWLSTELLKTTQPWHINATSLEAHLASLEWHRVQVLDKSAFTRTGAGMQRAHMRIPLGARGSCVRFRWMQPRYWPGSDGWALDDVTLVQSLPQPSPDVLHQVSILSQQLRCCSGCSACSRAEAVRCTV
ncbi:MAG: hypothetical protein EOO65_02685, partial [Methanosarcinales archaeon]